MFFLNKILLLKILLLISISASMHAAQINMRDADIRIFSADIAKLTNKTIILDPRIKGNVTVISDQDLDPDEAYAVFLSVLRLHGFSAIQTGDVIKVMPESGARQDASSNRITQDSLVTEVVKLSGADAKALVPLLKPLVNKQGHIAAYEATNTLILADYEGNISIYYTFSRFKKYIGKDIILKNNKRIFSCTKNDHLNDINDLTFGDAEATILHELLHTLGAPSKCGKNLDNRKSHVSDSTKDIMYKQSGKEYLDFQNNDYYNHNIEGCADLKNSNYLISK